MAATAAAFDELSDLGKGAGDLGRDPAAAWLVLGCLAFCALVMAAGIVALMLGCVLETCPFSKGVAPLPGSSQAAPAPLPILSAARASPSGKLGESMTAIATKDNFVVFLNLSNPWPLRRSLNYCSQNGGAVFGEITYRVDLQPNARLISMHFVDNASSSED
jgi:hypothetical protein